MVTDQDYWDEVNLTIAELTAERDNLKNACTNLEGVGSVITVEQWLPIYEALKESA